MIDLLPKVLKSLEDVGQKESLLKFMGLLASGTFPLHNICYLLFLDIIEWFSISVADILMFLLRVTVYNV
jgi:hypothetical protein